MNLLLLTSHSIAEYDDLRMFSDMGLDVFSIGAYTDPANPGDTLRPALPDAPQHPELAALCDVQRAKHAGDNADWAIDWAKADLHPDLIDWADVIVVHHFPERWLVPQYGRFRGKRVIWRTCGQSDPNVEHTMLQLRMLGLEVVRYSPKERETFEPMKAWAGEDALIRFGKYPADYGPWDGSDAVVGNITQDMAGRGDSTGLSFWLAATEGLPVRPAGPASEKLQGGIGTLSYDEMREYLRRCRAYLYTGTQPASYTLGLAEAMLSGTPVVSIGPKAWGTHSPQSLFEGHDMVGRDFLWDNHPDGARAMSITFLNDEDYAVEISRVMRTRAIGYFDVRKVSAQWSQFLDFRAPDGGYAIAREAVAV